jgi:hypothetical protein
MLDTTYLLYPQPWTSVNKMSESSDYNFLNPPLAFSWRVLIPYPNLLQDMLQDTIFGRAISNNISDTLGVEGTEIAALRPAAFVFDQDFFFR